MTKKQKLLIFMEENLNETNFLNCNVFYIDRNIGGTRTFMVKKQKALNHIEEKFNDDLVGHSGDEVMIYIIDWECLTIENEDEQ